MVKLVTLVMVLDFDATAGVDTADFEFMGTQADEHPGLLMPVMG